METFYPRLTMATAFGPEGCVILHMLAEIEPRVRVFNLDTGYQFAETLELRDRIAERYGIEVEMVRPETTVAEYEAQHGGPLYVANPDQCCYDRKIVPLRRALVGLRRLDHGDPCRPVAAPGRGAEVVGWDAKFGLVKVNPLLRWTKRDVWAFIVDPRGAVQPAARPGLSVDRLLAVHAGRCRRARTSGPAAGPARPRPSAACTRSTAASSDRARRSRPRPEARSAHEDLREVRIRLSGPAGPGAAEARDRRRCASARSPRATASPSVTWCRSCSGSRVPGWW